MNIFLLVPGIILFNCAAMAAIYCWPELLIQKNGHVAFAIAQTISSVGYLAYFLRFFSGLAPKILKANLEETTE
jgi:hypothetical protein